MSLWKHLRVWWDGEPALTRSDFDQAISKALDTQAQKHRRQLAEPTRARHLPIHAPVLEPGGKGPRKNFGYHSYVLRLFSRFSPMLRAVIDIRKREVAGSQWEIVPNLSRHEKELDTLRQLVLSIRRFPDRADQAQKWEPNYLKRDLVANLLEVTRSESIGVSAMNYRFSLALQDLTREAEAHAAKVRPLFDNPHPTYTWADILKAMVPDILTLDSGCLELRRALLPLDPEQKKLGIEVPRPDNRILQLHWVDGATVRPCVDERGMFRGIEDPHELAFEQWIDDQRNDEGGWKHHELLRIVENPQTDINFLGYGFSRVESLVVTSLLEANADKADLEEFKRDFYGGFLNVKDPAFQQEDVDAVTAWIEEALEGTRKLPVTAFEDIQYVAANPASTNRDKRGDERRQRWLQRICAIFEIAPLKLGSVDKTNYRNSDVSQEQQDDGLRALLAVVDDNITRRVVHQFGHDDIAYVSDPQHSRDEERELKNLREKAEMGILDVNDLRMAEGKEPLDLGDRSIWYFQEFEKARGQAEGMRAGGGSGEESDGDGGLGNEGMLDDDENQADPDYQGGDDSSQGKSDNQDKPSNGEDERFAKALLTQAQLFKDTWGVWPELDFGDDEQG